MQQLEKLDLNEELESTCQTWFRQIEDLAVIGLVIVAPDPLTDNSGRRILAVEPLDLLSATSFLTHFNELTDLGGTETHHVQWQAIPPKNSNPRSLRETQWLTVSEEHGIHSLFRINFPSAKGRSFEFYLFSGRESTDCVSAAEVAWSALKVWPKIQHALRSDFTFLSPRERQCLEMAFDGMTASESGAVIDCTERTVNFHLANAMKKCGVDNKFAAVQKACIMGLI